MYKSNVTGMLESIKTVLVEHWRRLPLNHFMYKYSDKGRYVYFLYHTSVKALEVYIISSYTAKRLLLGESPNNYLDYLYISDIEKDK